MTPAKSSLLRGAGHAYGGVPKWCWALWLAVAAVEIGCELAIPRVLQALVEPGTLTGQLASALVLLLVFRLAGGIASTWSLANVQWRLGGRLRASLLQDFLSRRRPLEGSTGATVELLENDVSRAHTLLGNTMPNLAVSAATVLGALAIVSRSNVYVAAWLLLVVVATVAGLNVIRLRAASAWDEAGVVRKQLLSFVESVFAGAPDICVNRYQRFVAERATRLMANLREVISTAYTRERRVWPFAIGLFGLCHAVSFSILALSPSPDPGLFVAVFLYTELIRKPVEATVANFAFLQDGMSSLERVSAKLPPPLAFPGSRADPRWHAALDFEAAPLRYPGRAQALIASGRLEVRPGEIVMLQGRTGAGKSTLGQYLARISSADGPPVETLGSRQPHVAYFGQREVLFDLTVRQNVELFESPHGERGLLGRYAGVLELPLDLDACASELSGPEQRDAIVFLRALSCDADLLVLDEPFASASADKIGRALAVLKETLGLRACVLISHRPEWRAAAVRCYSLEHGAIALDPPVRSLNHATA